MKTRLQILLLSWLSVSTLLLSSFSLNAQKAYDAILADPVKGGGIYNMYPEEVPSFTAAPKGYKPFYISHFGRHGARYSNDGHVYDDLKHIFDKAYADGKLTAKGLELMKRYNDMYPFVRQREEDLTFKGEEQEREIAHRMYMNCKRVFRKDAHVSAISSVTQRCIITMASFCQQMTKEENTLDITFDESEKFMAFMNAQSNANPTYALLGGHHGSNRSEFERDLRPFYDSLATDAILGRIFTDIQYADTLYKDKYQLTYKLFNLAASTVCLDYKEDFHDIFTPEEWYRLWEAENFLFYAYFGPSKYFNGMQCFTADTLLSEIITKADIDIAALTSKDPAVRSSAVSARLRFGHDLGIMTLFGLLKADGFNKSTDDPKAVADIWEDYNVPMASNIQLIFYRNRKGDILVRMMMNEKDIPVPVPTDTAPFYRWPDFRKYCLDRLSCARTAVADMVASHKALKK